MSVDNTSTFYKYCQDNVFEKNISIEYSHWFLIPAVAVIALLSILEKRKYVKQNIFGGRPALVSPFGFLDEPRNRWGIMFVFGSLTGNIVRVALKVSTTVDFPVWAKIFLIYILCLEVSVISYPLFACMTNRHKLIGGITGLMYAVGWFGCYLFVTIQTSRCYSQFIYSATNLDTNGYVIGLEIPSLMCNFLVIIKFIWKIYKCFKKGIYNDSNQEKSMLCKSYHLTYVKFLLKRNCLQQYPEKRLSMMKKMRNLIMRPVPGFRFPISIMITVFMSAIMLYLISLAFAFLFDLIYELWLRPEIPYITDLLQAANVVATILTIMCGVRNIYIFLINYRTDMLSLYKGDRSFIPATVHHSSPNVYMAQGMRFIGSSITGMLWGSVLCYLCVFIPLAMMMILIKCLVVSGKIKYLWTELEWLVYPACMIIIFKMQTFFIGRFFMQPKIQENDKHRPLAVDNRNAYNIFSFFMVFLNASIGVFTFLKRILVSALLGVFLIPRMDRCLLMRGYEAKDKCYVNYIGMIMVDVAHNHPVLRTFCFLLKSEIENKKEMKPMFSGEQADDNISRNTASSSTDNIRKRRWWLAYTLIRNPSLCAMRVPRAKEYTLDKSTVDLNDIQCSNNESLNVKNEPTDICDCSCRPICCTKYKFRIPPHLVTNMIALIVMLSLIIIYASVKLLIP